MQRSLLSGFVLRNLSRATLSKISETKSMSAAASLLQQQPNSLYCGAQKRFSSSVAMKLEEALQDEIKAEQRIGEENMAGQTPPTIRGFKIEQDGAEFRLTKTHRDEKICVTVNVNHSVDMDEEDELQMEEGRAGEEEREQTPVSLPPFQVEIIKGDQRLVFYAAMHKTEETLEADGGYDYSIEEFVIAPAGKSGKFEEVPENIYASSGRYIDPQLHELLFINYLGERGFNSQFCVDMVNFATYYEHKQFVQLLKKLKKFIGEQQK